MDFALKHLEENLRLHENTHGSRGGEEEEVKSLLSWFGRREARVLEIGGGTGQRAAALAEYGHRVLALDASEEAVALARKAAAGNPALRFEATDIASDNLMAYGVHDLVIALGNVISRLDRRHILPLFDRIRRALAPGGAFVFSAAYWPAPFQKNIVERDISGEIAVIWERELKEDKGSIIFKGHFLKEDATRVFELRCYKAPEMTNMLDQAGFSAIRWSNRLEFNGRTLAGAQTVFYRGFNTR